MADLYTFGEIMALFLATDTDSVRTANNYVMTAAGAESNVAVAATRLGLDVHLQSRLGIDQVGDNVLAQIAKEKVDTAHILRVPNYTGALVRNRGLSEAPDVTYLRQSSAGSTISPEDIDVQVLSNSRWLHVTGITVALSQSASSAVEHALEIARSKSVPVSFDLNIRRKLWCPEAASTRLSELVHDLDLVTGGVDEYELVFGKKDPEANLATVISRGVRTAIMTAGPELMRIIHEGERFDFSPKAIPTVDPVGSGDAFIAGTISGILGGLPFKEAIAQGSYCGGSVASILGDWAGLPYGKAGLVAESLTNGRGK